MSQVIKMEIHRMDAATIYCQPNSKHFGPAYLGTSYIIHNDTAKEYVLWEHGSGVDEGTYTPTHICIGSVDSLEEALDWLLEKKCPK